MRYFVYILRSLKDRTLYIGISQDPEKRLQEHNSGTSKYTKGHRPYKLLCKEEYCDRIVARGREKYLKTGHGRDEIRKIIPP
ncbi:MAG: GIY-YIG nuclease family protein [Candidatus Omnitrophota bacterium]|nr:GIY-YIG nuclease family protein [Candidatus Omnitrophota bacterium]